MRLGRAAALMLLVLLSLASTVNVATASPVSPVPDANARWVLGFCDHANRPITHGSILTQPFAAKVVSSLSAPSAYAADGRKATFYGYSPVKGVPPELWSPFQMAISSVYTNPKYPMAAQAKSDAALQWETTGFTPTWDGMVQMRLYLSAPATPPLMTPYAAALLKVTGNDWKMLVGDFHPNCAAGNAKTLNQILNATARPNITSAASPSASQQGSASLSPTPSASSVAASPSASVSATDSSISGAALAGSDSDASAGQFPVAVVAALVGLPLLGVAVALAARQRRASTASAGRRAK